MRHPVHITSIAALITVAACTSVPDGIIPPSEMSEVMADIHLGEAVVESEGSAFSTDSSKQALKQAILARHGVTSEQFDTSLYWYGQNIELFMEVNDKTVDILNSRLAEAQKVGTGSLTVTRFSQEGDSVNVWTGPSAVFFSETSPSEVINFYYTSDRNWEHGDAYTLRLKPIDTRGAVTAVVAVEYSDGMGEYVWDELSGDGMNELVFYVDSARTAVNLYGSISYSASAGLTAAIDSISLTRTRTRNNSLHDAASSQKQLRYR